MFDDALFTRGIQFTIPATGDVKRLAEQAAESFGVRSEWRSDDTRLVVMGPRLAVDCFVMAARAALTFCVHPDGMAEA